MTTWRQCSSCKTPIAHGARYYACSVSTCNRARSPFAFCSVRCWDAHVPVMNHRSAWAEERRAPSQAAETAPAPPPTRRPAKAPQSDPPRRRMARRAARQHDPADDDILIVASRLKAYVERKSGLRTAADVMPALSDIVRSATLDAIDRARADSRKTLKGRDFEPD